MEILSLIGIFAGLALMIYLTFMNPDFYRSDRGPAFNDRAFCRVLDEMYGFAGTNP